MLALTSEILRTSDIVELGHPKTEPAINHQFFDLAGRKIDPPLNRDESPFLLRNSSTTLYLYKETNSIGSDEIIMVK